MSGVGISGLIANLPTTVTPYPTQDPALELGGYRSVANIAARDAIPANFRSIGMATTLIDTGIEYKLRGGILNANWEQTTEAPFHGIYYVNPTFAGTQLGSQSNPFTTIAAAFTAAAAQGVTRGIIYTSSVTENVVFPTTGDWELCGNQNLYFPAQPLITGTIDLSSVTASRDLSLTNLEVSGLVSGTIPAGLGCTLRVSNCGLDGGINVGGPGNRPWTVLFVGNAQNGGSSGFGGYVDAGGTTVKGSIYAVNYSFLSAIAASSLAGNTTVNLDSCTAGNIAISITQNQVGALAIFTATDSNINQSTVTFAGVGLNVCGVDALTARIAMSNGLTVVGATATVLTGVRLTAQAANRIATFLAAKPPYVQMRVNATLTLTAPGTLGNAVLNVIYTDSLGVSRTKAVTSALNIAGAVGDEVQGSFLFTQDGSTNIQYSVTGITTPGALSYNLCASIEPAS